MPTTRIDSSTYTDMKNLVDDYTNIPQDTSINEHITDWSKWYGYYLDISPLSAMIDKKAIWTIGKGFKADELTSKILDNIKGFGKDTANTIFQNAVMVYSTGGDFLAEIVKNKRGKLINLKPLNPGQWKKVANAKGIIKYYEQISQEMPGQTDPSERLPKMQRLKPDEVFHLCWNRIADNIHGTGIPEKIENTLKAYKEAKNDMKKVFHRYVKPLQIIPVDTDDETQIQNFKTKYANAYNDTEIMVVPKDTVDVEHIKLMAIPEFSTLDPLPWIKLLEQDFFKAEGVPALVHGVASQSTEAESKIIYLAWQQVIEWNQLFLEQQIKSQLGLNVEFDFPASIAPELINSPQQDQKKKGTKDNKAEINSAEKQN